MSLGMIGRKVGMTRIFTEGGESVPVTVLDVSNNRVSQVKSNETDGYAAVQVAYGERRRSRINKAISGHLAKAGVESARGFHEFRFGPEAPAEIELGQPLDVSLFDEIKFVDISGVTKGKGFAGDRKSTRLNSSHDQISYAVFCLKKKKLQSLCRYAIATHTSRNLYDLIRDVLLTLLTSTNKNQPHS